MRLRNISGSREAVAASGYVVRKEDFSPGNWDKIFGNERPVRVEIGMGKGGFLHALAKLCPEINFIGIEKYSSVLIRAIQKMEAEELPNLKFIRMEAENITQVFAPGEADRIYLNFPDPWPKDRYAKRRLTSGEFLKKYDVILKKDGRLEFKTDNRELFEFSLAQLAPAGWKAEIVSFDLHGDEKLMEGNVMTEYEEKFSSMGKPIYKYQIYR